MSCKVSVVVPVYNVSKYIRECLKSVCEQDLKDIEIICVDDCGQDDSMDIVGSYAKLDSRIKIIRHAHNKGLGAARNTGIDCATGEYLGFVDSDDYVTSNFYSDLYRSAKEKGADIAQAPLMLLHENEEGGLKPYALNEEIERFNTFDEDMNPLEIYFNAGMCWNKIFKRDLVKRYALKFPEGVYWEDNPFVIRAAYYANAIVPAMNGRYVYRQRAGSIVTLKNRKLHFDLLETHKDIVGFINSVQISSKNYLQTFNRIMIRLIYEFNKVENSHELSKYSRRYWKEIERICHSGLYLKEYAETYPETYSLISYRRFNTLLRYVRGVGRFMTLMVIIGLKVLLYSPRTIFLMISRRMW